jgi:GNAT superfamily N-acetyltransferase
MSHEITLRMAGPDDRELLFHVFKMSLGPYIAQTYGTWQEDEQRTRFFEGLKPETHQIVEHAGQPVGLLSVVHAPGVVMLNRVFLLPPFQGRGLGGRLVRQVLADADAVGLPVRLRVLKVNPARRLYERVGFVEIERTETHFVMERPAQRPRGETA